ncbi:hypothetical protein HD553DRAFT_324645 [Filobasidium floriforme]|uniref:uncharacterized protein n=1 Tax=Filobasidium floriforme TaxID=5210 RepID=UPI001E8E4ECE|nr:uncharacterized protein HD553DRAFT_324645 [Filobasidium floriforme]KAH8083051.1 hypothetical protein HD553DRAFT_324645 [Filobasidium floriforme]
MQPNLASPPPPPKPRGPSPLAFLGLILGTTALFAYALERKSQTTTATSKRLRASDTIKPGNWMGDQEGVEDPEVERLRKVKEARERKEKEKKQQNWGRLGAVGGTEGLAGGWETVRSPGVQPPSTMPEAFRGEMARGPDPSHQEKRHEQEKKTRLV